ncbi:MAG: ABC transporter ATP-binding protein [Bacteroidia bacterium]|nr:ABC transporter ATP-binding protein [Bacteroidia bacterium]
MTDPSMLLQVQGLTTEFRSRDAHVVAVRNISFQVKKASVVGIVGESGSGKSVTSLSLMRLIQPPGQVSAGQAWFRNRTGAVVDLLTLPPREMQRYRGNELAMIFQEPMTALNPVYRCGDQVAEALRLHQALSARQAREAVLDLFREVELPRVEDLYRAYPHEVSGGQKQRVMIAMAIANRPSLLIADEPTTALDVTVQKQILRLIRRLQQEQQMSVMFITHDLGVVRELADDVLVMHEGQIVEAGPVEDLFQHPQHPYTRGLLACRPRMDRRPTRLLTLQDFQAETPPAETLISPAAFEARLNSLRSQAPLLQVKDLRTWYPLRRNLAGQVRSHVKAVDGVSLDVYPGETLGLAGESGCGKTTLGRTILRLTEPTQGQIRFDGQDITHLSQSQLRPLRRDMQIVFQDPYSSLNPRMRIGDAILEPMAVHQIGATQQARRDQVYELLVRVGLQPEMYQRYPHEFSGGQRQRICIARALALRPRMIICDESVSALDVSVQAQVLNLLKELQAELGLSYIFISHDLGVVKFMSDRILIMRAGKIVEQADAETLYRAPQSDYTRELIAAVPGSTAP